MFTIISSIAAVKVEEETVTQRKVLFLFVLKLHCINRKRTFG